jgi:hypothetical protein
MSPHGRRRDSQRSSLHPKNRMQNASQKGGKSKGEKLDSAWVADLGERCATSHLPVVSAWAASAKNLPSFAAFAFGGGLVARFRFPMASLYVHTVAHTVARTAANLPRQVTAPSYRAASQRSEVGLRRALCKRRECRCLQQNLIFKMLIEHFRIWDVVVS